MTLKIVMLSATKHLGWERRSFAPLRMTKQKSTKDDTTRVLRMTKQKGTKNVSENQGFSKNELSKGQMKECQVISLFFSRAVPGDDVSG